MKKRIIKIRLYSLPVLVLAGASRSLHEEGSLAALLFQVFGLILLVAGALGRIWSSAYISGMKNKKLVTMGPYSIVRNPLYFFSFLGFAGAGLAFKSWTMTAAFLLVFFLTHGHKIIREERKLAAEFPDEWEGYAKRVPRFIPSFRYYETPKNLVFFPVHFLRTVAEGGLMMLAFSLIQVLGWLQAHGVIPVLLRLP